MAYQFVNATRKKNFFLKAVTQQTFNCLKPLIEALKKGEKYVQN